MHAKLKVSTEGVSPLLLHNGQLADPLNQHTKRLKAVTSKKKKTEADYMEMAKIEFEGGLYVNNEDRVVLPSEMLERNLVEGAKKAKLGKQALAGMFITEDPILNYDGPKRASELWNDGRFRDTRGVGVMGRRIMRTRPKFSTWSVTFEVSYLANVLDRAEVIEAITQAGRLVGLGDYRPKFGRFEITNVEDINVSALVSKKKEKVGV